MSNISKTYVDGLELRIAELQEQVRVLHQALMDCADDMSDWASYASDYFQQKHGLQADIAKYAVIISATAPKGMK